MNELGGFLQRPEEIDGEEGYGTEEDLESFNYCLAYDYYAAICGEDFDSLGEDLNNADTWKDIMCEVCFWLKNETDKNIIDNLGKLYDGTILTYKNRTFIEACRSHGWHNLADSLSPDIKKKVKI